LSAVAAGARAEVVFSALQDGAWRLYRQTDPSAVPAPVPTPGVTGDQGAPRLSPSGAEVAFEVTGGGLRVCPLDGSASCRGLAPDQGFPVRPVWHPRTGGLVFSRYTATAEEERSRLEQVDSTLTRVEPLIDQTGIQDFPDLAPDGTRLAYTSWLTVMPYRGGVSVVQQLWTLDLVRARAGQLLLSNASDIHPRWSPDGSRLAFASNRSGRYEIWVVTADGSDPRQVTEGPGDKTWPVWSPDGGQCLFTHIQGGRSALSLVTLSSGELVPYRPFGADADIEIRDADWRAGGANR
jgi:Tol biopolymer transport system component